MKYSMKYAIFWSRQKDKLKTMSCKCRIKKDTDKKIKINNLPARTLKSNNSMSMMMTTKKKRKKSMKKDKRKNLIRKRLKEREASVIMN
jgi:hypothetical protein